MQNQCSVPQVNKFKDSILEDIGNIAVSDTQRIRVLKVWDVNSNQTKLSVQKWWRPNSESEWLAGKGFKLDPSEASILSELLKEGVKKF